jgi:hypothetical protein
MTAADPSEVQGAPVKVEAPSEEQADTAARTQACGEWLLSEADLGQMGVDAERILRMERFVLAREKAAADHAREEERQRHLKAHTNGTCETLKAAEERGMRRAAEIARGEAQLYKENGIKSAKSHPAAAAGDLHGHLACRSVAEAIEREAGR